MKETDYSKLIGDAWDLGEREQWAAPNELVAAWYSRANNWWGRYSDPEALSNTIEYTRIMVREVDAANNQFAKLPGLVEWVANDAEPDWVCSFALVGVQVTGMLGSPHLRSKLELLSAGDATDLIGRLLDSDWEEVIEASEETSLSGFEMYNSNQLYGCVQKGHEIEGAIREAKQHGVGSEAREQVLNDIAEWHREILSLLGRLEHEWITEIVGAASAVDAVPAATT